MTVAHDGADVLPFSPHERRDDEDEKVRRLAKEAERLADQSEAERAFYMPKRAQEICVSEKVLKSAVRAVQMERAKRVAAERVEKEREATQRAEAEAKEQRKHERLRKEERQTKREADKRQAAAKKAAEKEAEREKRKAEREAEREQRKAEKEAERKTKEKAKTFANLLKLPVALHAAGLAKLAARIGEDATALRSEFQEFVGVTEGSTLVETEAWDEPVNVAELLDGIEAKIRKYVVMRPYQRVACVLFDAQAWPHNAIATHSPILVATSPEPGSGKSVLLGTTARLTPKAVIHVETTGPNMFRLIDAHQPTVTQLVAARDQKTEPAAPDRTAGGHGADADAAVRAARTEPGGSNATPS
jgi:hypothetical protein